MASFTDDIFIYNKLIYVYDFNEICKHGKLFALNYSQHLPKYFEKETGFSVVSQSSSEDKHNLFEYTASSRSSALLDALSKKKDAGNKLTVLSFPNLCLFKSVSLIELTEIIALSLRLNTEAVNCVNIDTPEYVTLKNKTKYTKMPGKYYHQQVKENAANLEIYNRFVSLGDNQTLITLNNKNISQMEFYENTFYKNYINTGIYVYKILTNIEKQRVHTLNLVPTISKISVLLLYKGNPNKIDIIKLFNMHSAGNTFGKIYIQSHVLDSYEANPREMQYVKTSTNTVNPFNGVNSLYETCSLYYGGEICSDVILSSIDICVNGTIRLNFLNINTSLGYPDIYKGIAGFLDDNMQELLQKTYIEECVYDFDFSYENYVPVIASMSSSLILNTNLVSNISSISFASQTIPTVKFTTKTSIQMSSYSYHNLGTYYNFLYLLASTGSANSFLTDNVIQTSLLTTVHAGINTTSKTTAISIFNSYSYNELLFHYALLMGNFSFSGKMLESETLTKSTQTSIAKAPTFKSIQEKALNSSKQALTILYTLDPVLFGTRRIGNGERPYSGLAQKQNQRVVPITVEEYAIIKKERPHSATSCQNQTYKQQRIYLFCPYNETQYINFHAFPNQVCIPRCTAKPSNKTQFTICTASLDITDISVENTGENQSITLYNPLISRGRKCKLPIELADILMKYIAYKPNMDYKDALKWVRETYNKQPFVICRQPMLEKYVIWSEYSDKEDYVLMLFAEGSKNDCFIVVKENDMSKPFSFSDYPTVASFFSNLSKRTTGQTNFLNYIGALFNMQLHEYSGMKMDAVMDMLYKKRNFRFLINNDIVIAVEKGGLVYFTPKFQWLYNKENAAFITLKTFLMEKLKFASYEPYDIEKINKIYVDIKTQKLFGIEYDNVFTFVQQMDVPNEYQNLPTIQSDFVSLFVIIVMQYSEKEIAKVEQDEQIVQVIELFNNLVFAYVYSSMFKDNKRKLASRLTAQTKDSANTDADGDAQSASTVDNAQSTSTMDNAQSASHEGDASKKIDDKNITPEKGKTLDETIISNVMNIDSEELTLESVISSTASNSKRKLIYSFDISSFKATLKDAGIMSDSFSLHCLNKHTRKFSWRNSKLPEKLINALLERYRPESSNIVKILYESITNSLRIKISPEEFIASKIIT